MEIHDECFHNGLGIDVRVRGEKRHYNISFQEAFFFMTESVSFC